MNKNISKYEKASLKCETMENMKLHNPFQSVCKLHCILPFKLYSLCCVYASVYMFAYICVVPIKMN